MITPNLIPHRHAFWGREQELAELERRLTSTPHSLTLVVGDSGSGKTELLIEWANRLRRPIVLSKYGPDILCGFHPCTVSETDPLLRCLGSLLKTHILTVDNWPARIRTALEQVRHNLRDIEQLGAFCADLAVATGELPVVRQFAGIISKASGALHRFASLGGGKLRVLSLQLPYEVFAEMLTILSAAFPSHRFVFTIDNLNASAEASGAAGIPPALLPLCSFIDTRLDDSRGVHFVFSWKRSPRTDAAYVDFAHRLESRQVTPPPVYLLRPMSDDDISRWLTAETQWFPDLPRDLQSKVVEISAGSPLLVRAWLDSAVGPDLDQLRSLARDVGAHHNSFIQQSISKLRGAEHVGELRFLYQMTRFPSVLAIHELAEATGQSPQDVKNILDRWVDSTLIARSHRDDLDGPEYEFEHETKRDAAQDALSDALEPSVRRAARRSLYEYFVAHVGATDDCHPDSANYAAFAALATDPGDLDPSVEQLLRAVWHATNLTENLPYLEQAVSSPALRRMGRCFRRFVFLLVCERVARPFGPHLAERGLDQITFVSGSPVLKPDGQESHPLLLNYATAFGAELLAELQESHEVPALEVGQLIVGAAAYVMVKPEAGLVEGVLHKLQSLWGIHSRNEDVREQLIRGWALMAGGLVQHGFVSQAVKVLTQLESLQQEWPSDPSIAVGHAVALFNASVSFLQAGQGAELRRCVEKLRILRSPHSAERDVRFEYAKVLVNLSGECARTGDLRGFEASLGELRSLHTTHSKDETFARELAYALYIAVGVYCQVAKPDAVTGARLDLRTLHRRFPQDRRIAVIFAVSLADHAWDCQGVGDTSTLRAVLSELLAIQSARPENEELARFAAAATRNAIIEFVRVNDHASVWSGVDRLRALRSRFPKDKDVASCLAGGAANAMVATLGLGQRISDLLNDLAEAGRAFPHDAEIALRVSKGLLNATGVLVESGDEPRVMEVLEELARLSERFESDAEIAVRAAAAFRNVIGARPREAETGKIAWMLSHMRRLYERFGFEIGVIFRYAMALEEAARLYEQSTQTEAARAARADLESMLKAHPELGSEGGAEPG